MGKQWKRWQIYFILLGFKITVDSDCRHEIKRHLLLERKAMINLDSTLKSRDIANKGPSSQHYGFSSSHVRMWELEYKESWAPKNWCFWTVVLEKTLFFFFWRRLLRVLWTARRSNQSMLKEINSEYSLEGLMLKLKLQYFGQLMQRDNKLEKTLMLGKMEGSRRRGSIEDETVGWCHWQNEHESEEIPSSSGGQGNLECCSPWGQKESYTT